MIMRLMKIIKDANHETRNKLLQLIGSQLIVEILCELFFCIAYALPYMPLMVISIFESDIIFSITTQIIIIIFLILYNVGIIAFLIVFCNPIFLFKRRIAERFYYLVYTKKGKALSKDDFSKIIEGNEKLFWFIATQNCKGHCLTTCFEICKILEKGSIEFVAVKKMTSNNDEDDDGKEYFIHVLYLNNGWAFDTFSIKQYPVEKLHKIFSGKIYKVFNFESIADKDYEEFKKELAIDLRKWCDLNNCTYFVNK